MIRYTLNVTKVRCTWVVIALLIALNVTSSAASASPKTTAPTGLTPVQRKQLTDAQRRVNAFPKDSKMAFICEQLGLCFKRDGSQGMRCDDGKPGTWNDAFFVNSSGRRKMAGCHGRCSICRLPGPCHRSEQRNEDARRRDGPFYPLLHIPLIVHRPS